MDRPKNNVADVNVKIVHTAAVSRVISRNTSVTNKIVHDVIR